MIRTDLGIATAYAEAVSKGYTGTRDEFGQMFVDFGKTAEKVSEDKKAVEQMKASVEETKNSVDTTAAEFGQNVADKTEEAKADITEHANTEKASATAAISEAKDDATGAITEAQTSATDAIAAVKDSATSEIAKKGTDTLATIPEDYTALSKDVSSLKEDISNKITKFYASSQGETHLADSDDGKIMDMMIYGKSEQFTTTGKNLLKIGDGTQTTRGVTITAKDGVFALKGTAVESGFAIFDVDSFVLDGTCFLSSNISTDIVIVVANKLFNTVLKHNKPVTLENAEVSKICFIITKGKTYDLSNILVQIEKGSEATSYEPYTGGQPSPSPDYPQEIKSVVNPTVKISNEDGTKSQTVTLPYTLNAIPVSSGGNVTINGQQYVSDYIDVERGKVVRCVKREPLSKNGRLSSSSSPFYTYNLPSAKPKTISEVFALCNLAQFNSITTSNSQIGISSDGSNNLRMRLDGYATLEQYTRLSAEIIYELATPIEEDLTSEQIQSLQALKTKYPVTNIFITSDQLDGYTTFNYPISMANGWNYVKQQIGDTRDYIYDMDARTQDTNLQAAEAYVNSEYAVALTELEV